MNPPNPHTANKIINSEQRTLAQREHSAKYVHLYLKIEDDFAI